MEYEQHTGKMGATDRPFAVGLTNPRVADLTDALTGDLKPMPRKWHGINVWVHRTGGEFPSGIACIIAVPKGPGFIGIPYIDDSTMYTHIFANFQYIATGVIAGNGLGFTYSEPFFSQYGVVVIIPLFQLAVDDIVIVNGRSEPA